MNKEQIMMYAIILVVFVGIGYLAYKSFTSKNEEEIIRKYGKYFNSGYWKSEFKRLYGKEMNQYKKKGFSDTQINAYILNKYFDRTKYENIAQVIKDSKGLMSDDESKAILAIGELKNMMEVSYLATVFSVSGDSGYADSTWDFFSNPLAYVSNAVSGTGELKPEENNLLYFLLSYFNAKDRKLLHKILAKMKKRGEYKSIPKPTDV